MVGRLIAVELSKKYQIYAIDNNINNSKTLSADEDSDDKDKPPHY